VAGALPGGRAFEHYYQLIWSPLSVLAVLWLSQLQRGGGPSPLAPRIAVGLAAGVLVLAGGNELLQIRRWQQAASQGSAPVQAIETAAAFLDAETPADLCVPVCVWDPWTELYWRVQRPSVSHCAMPFCIAEIQPAMFAAWMEAMLRERPSLIVVDGSLLRAPGTPEVKGGAKEFVQARKQVATIQKMIDQDYVEIYRVEHKDVEKKLSFLARKGGAFDKRGKVSH